MNEPKIVIEHATMFKSGAMQVRPSGDDIERVYPLTAWIEDRIGEHTEVYEREIIVVRSWRKVKPPTT
jgi:hypothetical protein